MNRASKPTRSSTSNIPDPDPPERSNRRNAARVRASHPTRSGTVTSSIASSSPTEGTSPPSAASASASRIAPASAMTTGSPVVPAVARASANPTTCSTFRACSKSERMSPSVASRLGSSTNPISRATSGWSSETSRSARRPVSSWTALRVRTRNPAPASTAARSRARTRPALSRSVPNAAASQPSDATSRSPPLPSLRSGSNRWAVEPNRARRASAASRSRRANPAGSSRARARTGASARSASVSSPTTRRPSSIAVHASNRSVAARHSAGVRTACPTANAASHNGYSSASTVAPIDASSSWTTSRSMSDAGSWTIRPYPPIARIATPAGDPARSNSSTRHASTRPARRPATPSPWCPIVYARSSARSSSRRCAAGSLTLTPTTRRGPSRRSGSASRVRPRPPRASRRRSSRSAPPSRSRRPRRRRRRRRRRSRP